MRERNEARQLVSAFADAIEYEQSADEARIELVDGGVDIGAFRSRVRELISGHKITEVSAPKNTGGGGFVFEGDVCAWLMLCMLAGHPPLDASVGLLTRLDFQARVDGWLLDDVVMTTLQGADRHRVALSVKSNEQFGASSAPADFVLTVWQQWLGLDSRVFDRTRDYLGLVTAPMPDGVRTALSSFLTKAHAADVADLASRLATPGWANEAERKLFQSFKPPRALAAHVSNEDLETAALVQRLRFLSFDFGAPSSDSSNRALSLAREVASPETAQVLWDVLRVISNELRPTSGHITRQGLVDRLRGRVPLAHHPDHRGDWLRLDAFSRENLDSFSCLIAGTIPLPRTETIDKLQQQLGSHDAVAVTGRSGVGKSCVARTFAVERASRVLWFDARAFDNVAFNLFEMGLRLQHRLRELLATVSDPYPVLVIDGLDRVFTDVGYATAASLLRAARQDAPATQWRILIPCQSQSWLEVAERLQRAGFDVPWSVFDVEPVALAELEPVRQAIPTVKRLLLRPEVGALMGNLKILDLVVRRVQSGSEIDATAWVGEANVAHWFWEAEVKRGPEGILRARFARDLAERQGDQLLASIPSDTFDAAELASGKTLITDKLCVEVGGDRLTFAHDLFGDWARLRLLVNHHDDFAAYVRGRQSSPLWHRAIRLYGLHLLEQVRDLEKWKATLAVVDGEDTRVVQDLLLDAPVFAVNPRPLLESILPTLLANEGALLRRLFTRFLTFATLPDSDRISLARSRGIDEARARAIFRYPHWPYWIPVIAFVHERMEDILPLASVEVANMLEMWMPSIRQVEWVMRQAGDIAVALGRQVLRSRDGYGDQSWHQFRQATYRCLLAASRVLPDDVADVALRASSRRGIDFAAIKAAEEASKDRPRSKSFALIFEPGGLGDPWPDGPLQEVDEDFAAVAIEQHGLLSLLQIRPAEAREVLLACLIEEPQRKKWRTDFHDRSERSLRRYRWHPPFYTDGPFLKFLETSFDDGLDVIARLVDFATTRELAYRSEDDAVSSAEQAGVDADAVPDDDVIVSIGGESRTFKGGARVFGWSSGAGNPPETVQVALMALERYFYIEIEAEREVGEKALAVLRKITSVAFLRVLIDVGKRLPSLFMTSLQGVLGVPDLYEWDMSLTSQGRPLALFGAFNKSKDFVDEARAFHNLEHRRISLRQLAPYLIFASPAMTDFFAKLAASWLAIDAAESSMTAQLRVLLDPANWEDDEEVDGRPTKANRRFNERQRARAEAFKEQRVSMSWHLLPVQCRKILDDNKTLTDPELESLWETWSELWRSERAVDTGSGAEGAGSVSLAEDAFGWDEPDEGMFPDASANAILGCVAVFVRQTEWIDRHAERLAICREALEHVLANSPPAAPFDGPDNASPWTWQCFAAEVLVMLCARDVTDQNLRMRLAESVFTAPYAAVEVLFKRAAGLRSVLGTDFERLRRLSLEWSFVRPRYALLVDLEENARREGGMRFPTDGFDDAARLRTAEALEKWATQRVEAFVNATLDAVPADWDECDPRDVFSELDGLRTGWRRDTRPDLHFIKCAHSWNPLPEEARDEDERARWLSFWLAFVRTALPTPRPHRYREDEYEVAYPDEDERWLLDHLAQTILQATERERSDLLWTPIMDLPDEAHHWVEVFMRHVHLYGLTPKTTPERYETTYRNIVTYALSRAREWSSHDRVWDELIAIGDGGYRWWRDDHASLVESLQDVLVSWMERVPRTGTRIGAFVYWLAQPFGRSLRLLALSWLARMLVVDEEEEIYDAEQSEDGLVALLNAVWDQQEAELRANKEAFPAFQSLLHWLVERQNPGGLELCERLGGRA